MDVVDHNDLVLGQAPRPEIYKQQLCHRIVHVMVFNEEGKVVLQKRSANLSFAPDCWSTSAGGHVQTGENYEEAARREYEEELGVVSALELVGKDFYVAGNSPKKFLGIFKTLHNGPFNYSPEEVSEVAAFDFAELKQMIAAGEKFHPELIFILNKYYF